MNRRKTNGCILSVMLAACLLFTACGESAAASVMQLMKMEGAVLAQYGNIWQSRFEMGQNNTYYEWI